MNTTKTAAPGQLSLLLTTPIVPRPVTGDVPTRDDRLTAARTALIRGFASVASDPVSLAAFLAFRSRFRDYSLNNTVLIWLQRPTARYCMGLKSWAKHGRHVCKGERGLTILAPIVRKRAKAEVKAGAERDDETVIGYRTVAVFDYEQTAAARPDALTYTPPVPRLGTDAPDGLVTRLEAVIGTVGFTVRDTHLASYADGWCNGRDRTITVRADLGGADRAAVLCHELAHALAHVPAQQASDEPETTRAQKELQAEGAAYVALSALGLDTGRASLPYLKGWATDDEALAREMAAIDRIATDILQRVEAAAA